MKKTKKGAPVASTAPKATNDLSKLKELDIPIIEADEPTATSVEQITPKPVVPTKTKKPKLESPAVFQRGQDYLGIIIDYAYVNDKLDWVRISALSGHQRQIFYSAGSTIIGLTPKIGMLVSFRLDWVQTRKKEERVLNAFYLREVDSRYPMKEGDRLLQVELGNVLNSLKSFLNDKRKTEYIIQLHLNEVLSHIHKYLATTTREIPTDFDQLLTQAYNGTGLMFLGSSKNPHFLKFLVTNEDS